MIWLYSKGFFVYKNIFAYVCISFPSRLVYALTNSSASSLSPEGIKMCQCVFDYHAAYVTQICVEGWDLVHSAAVYLVYSCRDLEKMYGICMSPAWKDKAVYVCGDSADLSNAGYVFHQYSVLGMRYGLMDSAVLCLTARYELQTERRRRRNMHSHTTIVLVSEVNLRNALTGFISQLKKINK